MDFVKKVPQLGQVQKKNPESNSRFKDYFFFFLLATIPATLAPIMLR